MQYNTIDNSEWAKYISQVHYINTNLIFETDLRISTFAEFFVFLQQKMKTNSNESIQNFYFNIVTLR